MGLRFPRWVRAAFPPYALDAWGPGKAVPASDGASARVAARAEAGAERAVAEWEARNAGTGPGATVQAGGGRPVPVTAQAIGYARQAPAAGSVFSGGGWLAGEAVPAAARPLEARGEPEPDTVPLRKAGPLPDGVLGYVVVLRGESRDVLADSDLRRSLEAAQADAGMHGKRAGWAGRAVACEVRVAGVTGLEDDGCE